MLKYCVAQVNIDLNGPRVSFYAATALNGIYRVEDINDPNLTWYDTREEALAHRMNANDCVVSRIATEEVLPMITVKYDWAEEEYTTYGIEERFETWNEATDRVAELRDTPFAERVEIIDERY